MVHLGVSSFLRTPSWQQFCFAYGKTWSMDFFRDKRMQGSLSLSEFPRLLGTWAPSNLGKLLLKFSYTGMT